MSFPHTTEDLARVACVGSEQVLRWYRAGFFAGTPEPSRQGGPGKGVRLFWSEETMARVREIVKLKHEHNMSHEHIRQHFGGEKKPRTRK